MPFLAVSQLKTDETVTDDSAALAAALASPPSVSAGPSLPWMTQPRKEERQWFTKLSDDTKTGTETLPFDCSGCGKCCKTRGEVYLSPNEATKASTLLGLSINEFKAKYVLKEEVTVAMSLDSDNILPGESGWVLLQNKEEDGSCIFLGEDNLCSIYEARPLQCSTYPFWPRIMANKESWNEEVRMADGEEGAGDDTSSERYWSVEEGGCEGMGRIGENGSARAENGIKGVSVWDAKDRLETFERYKRRFPQGEFAPIKI